MTNYRDLVKQRTSIPGYVEEVERFNAWWNNNLATVVNYYDGYYRVFLLVYVKEDNSVKLFPESISNSYWGEHSRGQHNSSYEAKREAGWLRRELSSSYGKYHDNPILLIHPACDCFRSFSTFVSEPYVVKKNLPEIEGDDSSMLGLSVFQGLKVQIGSRTSSEILTNPNNYLKTGDVVWSEQIERISGVRFYHVGVYLGDGWVCHFSKEKNGTYASKWKDFLEKANGELIRFRPIIPFKHYSKIAKQIAWAVNVNYRQNNYDLANNNCEHFANMVVYGINYSKQIYDNETAIVGSLGLFNKGQVINNDKGSTIKLTNEINESNGKLGENTSNYWYKEIKEQIEIPPRQECKIM